MIDELIESNLGYAHAIAAELAGKYPPNITRSDLKGAAEFGLVQAAHSYDPSRNVSFVTFAYYRIRGAIVDEVRKSWQTSHLKVEGDGLISEVPATGGLYPEEHAFQDGALLALWDGVVEKRLEAATESPASWVLRKEESAAIRKAIQRLPKRHRFVLWSHYYEDLSLASLGAQLNLSRSSVSRIHSQALIMISNVLRKTYSYHIPIPRGRFRRRGRAVQLQATLCSE